MLLVGFEDGVRWHLYTFQAGTGGTGIELHLNPIFSSVQDGYLSISPNKWSPTDLSKDTQAFTKHRSICTSELRFPSLLRLRGDHHPHRADRRLEGHRATKRTLKAQ